MQNNVLECASGKYTLFRLPHQKTGSLRAWDAADELLLQWALENDQSNSTILIVNDSFGALALGLHQYKTDCWSDSFVGKLATQKNFKANKIPLNTHFLRSTETLPKQYELVLIKIPKTLALLEDQLFRLKAHIHPNTKIIASGMSKNIHTSTLQLFEKIIGATKTSRATKKARLIFSENTISDAPVSPYPKLIKVDDLQLFLKNYANVFSQDHLDIGTRFFIENMAKIPPSNTILDLGCGNGALGIIAQRHQKDAHLVFVDESYAALASAKENYSKNISEENSPIAPNFIQSHCLDQIQNVNPDLILCNPPFHQAYSVGDQIAWQMFKQSFEKLSPNGQLWIIGNRHLGYHVKLKKLFGNYKNIASNKKFIILSATKKA